MDTSDFTKSEKFQLYNQISMERRKLKAESLQTFYRCQQSCYANILEDSDPCNLYCEEVYDQFKIFRKRMGEDVQSPLRAIMTGQVELSIPYKIDQ